VAVTAPPLEVEKYTTQRREPQAKRQMIATMATDAPTRNNDEAVSRTFMGFSFASHLRHDHAGRKLGPERSAERSPSRARDRALQPMPPQRPRPSRKPPQPRPRALTEIALLAGIEQS
jgi:hypothetical protein